MNPSILPLGLIIYAIIGSLIVNGVRFTGVEKIQGVFTFAQTVAFAVIAIIPLLFFVRSYIKEYWGRMLFFAISCLLSPVGAQIAGVAGLLLYAVIGASVPDQAITGFVATSESLLIALILVLLPSIIGSVPIFIALMFFSYIVVRPKYFIFFWFFFVVTLPLGLAFFLDMTPFGDLALDSTSGMMKDVALVERVMFFWQAGILFLIGLFFSRVRSADNDAPSTGVVS